MVDAVLLEWDGVLADTGDARHAALQRALADEGVTLAATASDATLAGLVALRASSAFVAALARGFSLRAGAAELVSHLELHTRVAIVTQATRAETEVALRLAGIEQAAACVVTQDDVLDPPPASELYERALARLSQRRRVAPERVVALVSTAAQVRAARAAGVRVLAVCAPAHIAIEADGAVIDLGGLSADEITVLAGVPPMVLPE